MSCHGNQRPPYTSRAIAAETSRLTLAAERLAIIAAEMGVEPEVARRLADWVRCDLAVWLNMTGAANEHS